jgi:cysteine desulfurase
MIYLDYSATTPVNKEVLDTYIEVTNRYFGNPNSLHKLGLEAKKIIDASSKQIASILGVKASEIIYTSGASEANNMAIIGTSLKHQNRGRKIISTELEHSSVLESLKYLETLGFTINYVKLDNNGQVDLADLERLLDDETILVSINSVSSELGIRQPIEEIGKLIKKYPKCYFHSDITQSMGKEVIDLSNIDLASFSAQKFFGMKGIGALIKKDGLEIEPLIHGGKSTTSYRSGTPATALIASMAKALRLAYLDLDKKNLEVSKLHDLLIKDLKSIPGVVINSNKYSVPQIINISIPGHKAETMLHALEAKDIYISTKTACTTSNLSSSVMALTKDKNLALSSLRISISYLTTEEEIKTFSKVFKEELKNIIG